MIEKIKKFIKKNWKWFALILGGIIAIFYAKRAINAVIGKVSKAANFIGDKSDNTIIYVKDGDGWKKVKLPTDKKGKQITYKKVKAAGLSKTKAGETKVKVELIHETTNRRTGTRVDDSAGSRLGG